MLAALRLDILLQRRYGFYYAALFSAVVWIGILIAVPGRYRDVTEPVVLFADLAVVGFFFIAGAVFFEKDDRTLFALVATPLRFREYLAGKVVTLTALAVVLSFVVVLPTHGLGFDVALMVLGVVLTSFLMLLAGLVSAMPFPSLSEWLIPSGLVLALMNVPLVGYAGWWESPILYALPTHGSYLLLGAAFGTAPLATWQLVYAVGYLLAWVAGLGMLAHSMFDRYVVARS